MTLQPPKNSDSLMVDLATQPSVSQWVDQFEIALQDWREDRSLQPFFPDASHPQRDIIVAEIMRVYLEWNWHRGRFGTLDHLLAEFHWLKSSPNLLSQVAFEDFRLRSSSAKPKPSEFYRETLGIDISRWRGWLAGAEDQLGSRFTATESGFSSTISGFSEHPSQSSSVAAGEEGKPTAGGLSLATATSRLPLAGERFGDFDLLLMIGEGAFSRVFVARQKSLADRLIVVKVTRTPLGESQHLARLQHGNIMPLYSSHRVAGLYLLVMPFLGSVTLKELIADQFGSETKLGKNDRAATIAQYLADRRQLLCQRLGQLEETGLVEENAGLQHRLEELLGDVDWQTGILRIFANLADGLNYAHRRGIQLRDIKPANILLGFDGQPILLDFNLSRISKPEPAECSRAVGGTLVYMAPEHQLAMQTGIDDLTPAVDIFSLGVVLHESLTGVRPQTQKSDLRSVKPNLKIGSNHPMTTLSDMGLSPAVASIITKSLEPDPVNRYPSAAVLQDDLQRHLLDLPLGFANNPSRLERWQKFRRRNRRLFSLGGLLAISVALAITAAAMGYVWLMNLQAIDARDRYAEFMRSAHLAEAELFLADGGSREQGRKLIQQTIFSVSSATAQPFSAGWTKSLDVDRQRDVSETRDYLSRLVERKPSSPTANLPDDAPRTDSSTNVGNGKPQLTNLEVATEAFHRRDFQAAIEKLESEIRIHPQRFVLWFLKGKCQFDLREYREAERSFAMSLTIQPDCVPALVAQGISFFGLTQFAEAEQCFREAIRLQPDHFAAHYNLALVMEKQIRFEAALDQLELCEQLRNSSTRVWMTRSRVARSAGNLEMANLALSRVKTTEPDEPDGWVLRGLARLSDSPEEALQDFAEAQKFPSTRFSAGQNRAHVLSEFLGRPAEAIAVLSTLIEEDPNFLPALAGRAVLLARLNHAEQAAADLELLKQKPLSPQLHYQIACVYALLSPSERNFETLALEHLAIAAQPAYGGQIIASDKDLNALRKNSKFETILQGITLGNSLRLNH